MPHWLPHGNQHKLRQQHTQCLHIGVCCFVTPLLPLAATCCHLSPNAVPAWSSRWLWCVHKHVLHCCWLDAHCTPAATCCLQRPPGVPAGRGVAQHQPLGAGDAARRRAGPPCAALWQPPGSCQLLLLRGLLRVSRKVGRTTGAWSIVLRVCYIPALRWLLSSWRLLRQPPGSCQLVLLRRLLRVLCKAFGWVCCC